MRLVNGRRGGNAIEFALTLPAFVFLVFSTVEYGYYFYLSSLVENANRIGCRLGGVADPEVEDPAAVARSAILGKLETEYNIPCGDDCELLTSVVTYGSGAVDTPDHLRIEDDYVTCELRLPYVQTTGMLNVFPPEIVSKMVVRLEVQE
jgi:hypothetical protein